MTLAVTVVGATVTSLDDRSGVVAWIVVAACVAATGLAGVRWLRVAQREHYLPDSVSRFALRWWVRVPVNAVATVVAAAGLFLSDRWPVAGLATAAVVAAGPAGLGIRGRSAPLAWTRRLRTLAGAWLVMQAVVVAVGIALGVAPVLAAAGALVAPALVDLACGLTSPFEKRAATRHVESAAERLARVAPKVVAITGSYGKTSTKGYVAHLLKDSVAVVASPASFNNRAGLSRAVNEHLAPGTEVFVAEMGTYGPGEIAELCEWLVPDVAVITAVGPVHLERFGTEERIVEAKAEILAKAASVVLVADDPRLARLADGAEAGGKRVWRVSATDPKADVAVVELPDGVAVYVRGDEMARGLVLAAPRGNVAAALAVALELGIGADTAAHRLPSLPTAAHRLEVATAPSGVVVLDDTYNANPAGARAALAALAAWAQPGRRSVVVTPGMVELGKSQVEENALFAEASARLATDLILVGRTNRRALLEGVRRALTTAARNDRVAFTITLPTRQRAVEWVRENLGTGDVVLYENDLPDHYP